MNAKKNLGLGLDLLLSAAGSQHLNSREEEKLKLAKALFTDAMIEDGKGRSFEAYYLYRRVVDILESQLGPNIPGTAQLVSRACNNLAIILYENGDCQGALAYLQKALAIHPENQTARENLEAIN